MYIAKFDVSQTVVDDIAQDYLTAVQVAWGDAVHAISGWALDDVAMLEALDTAMLIESAKIPSSKYTVIGCKSFYSSSPDSDGYRFDTKLEVSFESR